MEEPASSQMLAAQRSPPSARSSSSSASSINEPDLDHAAPPIFAAPAPIRPPLNTRQSSDSLIVDRNSSAAFVLPTSDIRPMSPRRSSQDLEVLGRETRDELKKHAKALQDSLLTIIHRIEAVKEEHDKLDNNNKFLQKYIGDLMMTSKITSTSSRSKK